MNGTTIFTDGKTVRISACLPASANYNTVEYIGLRTHSRSVYEAYEYFWRISASVELKDTSFTNELPKKKQNPHRNRLASISDGTPYDRMANTLSYLFICRLSANMLLTELSIACAMSSPMS